MREIHAIVTRGGPESFLVESPQIPGFVMIRSSMADVGRDLRDVLADIVEGSFKIISHHQWTSEYPDNPGLLFRIQDSPGKDERIRAVSLVQGAVFAGYRANWPPPGVLGDVLVIGCVATDTLGMVADQITDDDGIPMLALQADRGIWVVSFEIMNDGNGETFDPNMTVAEFVGHAQSVAGRELALVAAP